MIGKTASTMLADLIGAAGFAHVLAPAAKAANPAIREHRRGASSDATACEGLRKPANAGPDSQEFASHRSLPDGLQSEQIRGPSQNSQDSQGYAAQALANLAAVARTDADVSAFTDRRARLLRWGWTEAEAERVAERLARQTGSAKLCGGVRPPTIPPSGRN